MVKAIFLFIYTCISINKSPCQDTASLRKYSYLLFFKTRGGENLTATGFFIKHKKSLYLVTAKHVLTGKDYFNGGTDFTPADSISIVLPQRGVEQQKYYKMVNPERKNKDLFSAHLEPDLSFCKIPKSANLNPYTIETLIPEYGKLDMNRIEQLLCYGYSLDTVSQLGEGRIIGSYETNRFIPEKDVTETTNYWVASKTINHGYSGAPVFVKKDGKYFFGGMCVAGKKPLDVALIVRPELILNRLKTIKKIRIL